MTTPTTLSRSLGSRVVKKLEKPKPLKLPATRHSAPDVPARYSVVTSMEEVMSLVDKVTTSIVNRSYSDIQVNTTLLTSKLKTHGHQLEESYKDQLDRAFVSFRNACRDEKLELIIRRNLLYLIELRAMQWQSSNSINNYYLNKSSTSEIEGASSNEQNMTSLGQSANVSLLLGPGEVIKSSGKFSAPTKMPGKNYCKDEVVIRNADSGKVNPGAKERLVQITGPTEDKIEYAKHLMEDTIKRNASPVREILEKEHTGGSNSSLNSSTSDDSNRMVNYGRMRLRKLLSMSDIGQFDYKHTVNVNNDLLHIASPNLELLREAKIILEDYFHGGRDKQELEAEQEANEIKLAELKLKNPESMESGESDDTNTLTAYTAAVPEASNVSGLNCSFTDADSTLKTSVNMNNYVRSQSYLSTSGLQRPKFEYSRQFLLDCSVSVKSHQPPKQWERIAKEYPGIIRQVIMPFDAVTYAKKWNENEARRVVLPADIYPDSD